MFIHRLCKSQWILKINQPMRECVLHTNLQCIFHQNSTTRVKWFIWCQYWLLVHNSLHKSFLLCIDIYSYQPFLAFIHSTILNFVILCTHLHHNIFSSSSKFIESTFVWICNFYLSMDSSKVRGLFLHIIVAISAIFITIYFMVMQFS